MGTSYFHELTRQAVRVAEEMSEEAVAAPGIPRTVSVLRRSVAAPADTAAGIPATWNMAPGLDAVQSLIFYPRNWNIHAPAEAKLLDAERMIVLMDVPASAGQPTDIVLRTDRIRYSDSEYGDATFEVLETQAIEGPGAVRVKVKYAREGTV